MEQDNKRLERLQEKTKKINAVVEVVLRTLIDNKLTVYGANTVLDRAKSVIEDATNETELCKCYFKNVKNI